ncbi:MAG TPA: hypothetical protein VME67_04255 [Mycobacterium sp.]|nr:hypothetical protein [Mycobacterium sp.]HTX94115.1 hypothetical protein [Mycobacterium sp.]
MITFDNHARLRGFSNPPGRPGIEVCIEGVRRADGAVRLGILVSGTDCRQRHYG